MSVNLDQKLAQEVVPEPFQAEEETPAEAEYRNRQTNSAILTLLFFSVLMFSLPFLAFFGVRHYLQDHYQIYDFTNTCWSVLAAVVTANLIICLYVYKAYRDNEDEVAREKRLKDQ